MKMMLSAFLACGMCAALADYRDASLPVEERVNDLVSRMTIEEKCAQLGMLKAHVLYSRAPGGPVVLNPALASEFAAHPVGRIGMFVRACWWSQKNWSNGMLPTIAAKARNEIQRIALQSSRLGIPLWFEDECPHGLMALGAPVYPTGLGLGSTFDAELIRKFAMSSAKQAKARGIDCVYGPILDIARDPRWSRCEECFGEDPALVSILGEAATRGYLEAGVSPCLKHFVAGGCSEGGHNTASVHCGAAELFNVHLRPFRCCIDAGAMYLMSTYHDVDGELCTSSSYLLTDILRGHLGFTGFVRADAQAIPRALSARLTPADDVGAPNAWCYAMSLVAGCDSEDRRDTFAECGAGYLRAFRKGLVAEAVVDRAVSNVLRAKFEAGLFEKPYAVEDDPLLRQSPVEDDLALEAARKSLVLLKNNGVLPLSGRSATDRMRVAVLGPNAGAKVMNQLGDYTAPQRTNDVITVREALSKHYEVAYAKGCGIRSRDKSGFQEAIQKAKESDVTVLVMGGSSAPYGDGAIGDTGAFVVTGNEADDNDKESGEGTDRLSLTYSGVQLDLFRALREVSRKLVVVLIQGRPLACRELVENADAVLMAWYPGSRGGEAVAEALVGMYNPGGRLPISIPDSVGQVPVCRDAVLRHRPRYIDGSGEAFLPFGFGLSYTSFSYSPVEVENENKNVRVSVTVTNTGSAKGDEIVRFYLTSKCFGFVRPWRELFAFERVTLLPGESRKVAAVATEIHRGWYDRNGRFVPPRGEYAYTVGE